MQYMLLIYHNEKTPLGATEMSQMMQEYMTFTQDIVKAGKFKAGDRVELSDSAKTVQVRNGKTTTKNGPCAAVTEQLGGYYIVETKDIDEAVAIAARIPGAKHGSVEVRPIAQMSR